MTGEDKMDKKAILVIIMVISSMLFIGGCIQTTISGSEKIVNNVSTAAQGTVNTLINLGKTFSGNKKT